MRIINPTSLQFAPFTGRLGFPKHSLTCIVKGTFDLRPGAAAVLAEKQEFPDADQFYPGDDEQNGSPRYESDFAWFKPRADLLLVGACHVPGGAPAAACPVVFRVGARSKTINVIGSREWERRWPTWRATDPLPFTRLDLRWENSFGGEEFAPNPVGKGYDIVTNAAGEKRWDLPNLEDPANMIRSHGNRPAAIGFGPLNRKWQLRHKKLGTYKGAYRKTRWPWFPEDFDWSHLNGAPEDQQVDGYLRGDEPLGFENLHPKHPQYVSQLPGIRVRCFVQRQTGPAPADLSFAEVEMKLDTLWVDMEKEKLVLLWRGWTEVSSADHEEVSDIYIASEPLARPPATIEQHRLDMHAHLAAAQKPFEPEAPPPEPAEVPSAAAPEPPAAAEKAALLASLMGQIAALNAATGIDQLAPKVRDQVLAEQAKVAERLAENNPAKSGEAAVAARKKELQAAMAKAGLDKLPEPTTELKAEQARLMASLGLDPAALQSNPHLAELGTVIGAMLTKASATPANFAAMAATVQKLKETVAKSDPKPVPEPPPVPPAPKLKPADVAARHQAKAGFANCDLSGLDLSGQDLAGADFCGANLSGAKLRKTNLALANLSKANLTGADLTEAMLAGVNAAAADFSRARLVQADLTNADLTRALLPQADLTKAVLHGTMLEEADLRGARLVEASAAGAILLRANLALAVATRAVCASANFSHAQMGQANFEGADLTDASFNGVVGPELVLTDATVTKLRAIGKCDLTGARLVRAKGEGSIWKDANLTGADLRYARLPEAMFTSACLKQANLSASDMKQSRFNKADLREAKMRQMNLFQGSLEKAHLGQTDLSGSNLYEAELLDAVFDRTVADGANLKMTKLDLK